MLGIRSSIGLGLVCLVIFIVGGMLSIAGSDKEQAADRVTYAQQGSSGEALVEGTIAAFDPGQPLLRAPYSEQEVVGFRSWIVVAPEIEEPFVTGDQQVLLPFTIEAEGTRYLLDFSAYHPEPLAEALWITPRNDNELLSGAPTFDDAVETTHRREIVLKVGDSISAIGKLSENEAQKPVLGGSLKIFRGTAKEWKAHAYVQAGGSKRPIRLFGLTLMGLGGIGGVFLVAALIRMFWQLREQRA